MSEWMDATRIGANTINGSATALVGPNPSGTTTNLVFDVRGLGTASVQTTATTALAYKLYVSADGGTTWAPVRSVNSAGTATAADTAITADVTIMDYAPVETATHFRVTRTAGSGTFTFSGHPDPMVFFTVAASSGTVDTELPAARLMADNLALPTAPDVLAGMMVYDGATLDMLRGTAADGALVNLGTNNDVTVTSGNITADTELPAAAALTDNFANPTAPGVGAFGMVWDGATWDRAAGTSADGTLVNLGANNDVIVTSGFAKQVTPTVGTAAYVAGDVIGGILSFTTINSSTGRPVKIQSISLVDKSQQSVPCTFLFFSATPSGGTYTDGSPLVFGSGDYANYQGAVRFMETEWTSYPVGTPTDDFASKHDLGAVVSVAATTLFVLVIADVVESTTLTNGDFIININGEQL